MGIAGQVLGVVAVLLTGSFLIGYPLAYYFYRKSESQCAHRQMLYLSPVFGFSILCFLSMLINFSTGLGTDYYARILFLSLVVAGGVFIFKREDFKDRRQLLQTTSWLLLIFVISSLAASTLLYPVVMGHWLMAYGTGDDAARWLMGIDYFTKYGIEFELQNLKTLELTTRERFLYFTVGANISSIFGITSALSYSIMSGFSMILSSLALFALLDPFVDNSSVRLRVFGGIAISLMLAFYPPAIHVYYQGYHTHHFSVYAFLGALSFLSLSEKPAERTVWYIFWFLMLASLYTYRYVLLLSFLCGVSYLVKIMASKKLKTRLSDLKVLVPIIIGAFSATIILAYEVRMYLRTRDNITSDFSWSSLTLQKSKSYYWGEYDFIANLFTGFGAISPWQTIANYSIFERGLIGAFIACCLLAPLFLIKAKKNFNYLTILFANALVFLILIFFGQTYVLYKMLLYWPLLLEMTVLILVLNLLASQKISRGFFAMILIGIVISAKFTVSEKAQNFYFTLIESRSTRVDSAALAEANRVKAYLKTCTDCKNNVIFSHDISEHHLISREIFRDFKWQPIRGHELNFDLDIIQTIDYDKYDFELLLVGKFQACSPFDFSGNRKSFLFGDSKTDFYSRDSSLVEFYDGINMASRAFDEKRGCHPFVGQIGKEGGTILFVNKGGHSQLNLEFTYSGKIEELNRLGILVDDLTINTSGSLSRFQRLSSNHYSLNIAKLSSGIHRVKFKKNQLEQELDILSVSWQ